MEKVKKLVEAGASIPTAIKESLGMTVSEFAEKHGLRRSSAANHINGSVRADDSTVAALVAELGGTADAWRELLWLAAEPKKANTPEAPPMTAGSGGGGRGD